MLKNISIIQKVLNEKNKSKLTKNKSLDEFNWDSMSMIMLISILKEEFKKKNVNLKKLRSIQTISDLDNFINENKK
jgi:acyl carrier protein